jgi:hypothetical protein
MKYIIYKITCRNTGEIYFGKTSSTLEKRMQGHIYNKKTGSCCCSKQIIERNNFFYEKINECSNNYQSIKLERYYIENFKCINQVIPGRTRKERSKLSLNKKKRQEYSQKNKNKISEQKKEYFQKNKNKILEQKKEYREKNKDIISKKAKEKYTCKCGSIISKGSKFTHEKSIKHNNYIKK